MAKEDTNSDPIEYSALIQVKYSQDKKDALEAIAKAEGLKWPDYWRRLIDRVISEWKAEDDARLGQ